MTRVEGQFRFIGQDRSLGYRKGRVYTLTLAKPGRLAPVEIVRGGPFCPYGSESAFLDNWEPVGVGERDGDG